MLLGVNMKTRVLGVVFAFGVLGVIPASPASSSIILDQSSLLYDGGLSALGFTNYSYWETFTAGITGELVEIDLGFFNGISQNPSLSGTGELDIFSGGPPFGTPLSSTEVSVFAPGSTSLAMNSFPVSVPITAGATYAFQFTPIDMPFVFGIGIGVVNPNDPKEFYPPYSGGNAGITYPSGLVPLPYNFVFDTYVAVPEPSSAWLLLSSLPCFFLFSMTRGRPSQWGTWVAGRRFILLP
jgi:hypothetical protein